MVLCLVKQFQIVVSDMGFSGIRTAGNDLHSHLASLQFRIRPGRSFFIPSDVRLLFQICPEIGLIFKEILPRSIIPVQCKADLQAHHCFTGDPQMGISPITESGIL